MDAPARFRASTIHGVGHRERGGNKGRAVDGIRLPVISLGIEAQATNLALMAHEALSRLG